jgi:hypothetical protein
MVRDPGRSMAPGVAADETNGPAVRSSAQMAGRARTRRRGHGLVMAAIALLAAGGASLALGAPSLAALAHSVGLVPVVHHDSFQAGTSGISIAGTYGDCSGRSPVGWDGAYYEPCMGLPYWIGHKAILGAILSTDEITYWDAAGVAHRWRVIGRRVFPAGSRYPGRLAGAVAELQTCLEAFAASSPVEIVDYS